MFCLICEAEEQNYIPVLDTSFICSRCVQVLINANQDDLKRAYDKATAKGYTRKANAIESFLIEGEVENERETKTIRRNLVRERPMRKVRPTRDQFRAQ